MSNELSEPETLDRTEVGQPPMPTSRSSTAKKLVQAAALAAVLVPLGSIAVESSSITCSYGSGFASCTAGGEGLSSTKATYDFGAYFVNLAFDSVSTPFDITVSDIPANDGSFTGSGGRSLGAGFEDYVCVGINPLDTLSPCVEFLITQSPSLISPYSIFVGWLADTNGAFSNEPGNRIRLLKADGSVYDQDITTFYFPGTEGFPDPGVGGDEDSFSYFSAFQAPATVPEPASLILLTTGLGGLVYRRRRRRKDETRGST
jgi:hypothetical protein